MKVLSIEREADPLSPKSTVWICEARILSKHGDPASVLLEVDSRIYNPGDYYLRDKPKGNPDHYTQCAGVIEATDKEMDLLTSAGYRLADLRKLIGLELVKQFR